MGEESSKMTDDNLANILSGDTDQATDFAEVVVEETATETEQAVEATETKGETESSEQPAVEPVAEPPSAQDETAEATGQLAALKAERQKRQELQSQLDKMNQQKVETPDPLEDPEGYQRFNDNQRASDRLELSSEIGRTMYEDFDEKYQVFLEEAQSNPALVQQVLANPASGIAAYKMGVDIAKRREIGDPEQYATKRVEEATKPLMEKLAALEARIATGEKAAQIPPSLAGASSKSANDAIVNNDLQSLLD